MWDLICRVFVVIDWKTEDGGQETRVWDRLFIFLVTRGEIQFEVCGLLVVASSSSSHPQLLLYRFQCERRSVECVSRFSVCVPDVCKRDRVVWENGFRPSNSHLGVPFLGSSFSQPCREHTHTNVIRLQLCMQVFNNTGLKHSTQTRTNIIQE
jgi:hypothetical protein